ncbi:hypothetical protein Prudu_332S000100 [Prunus dulcis]|uniref:Uncharacterized protein n=1 Tax=Prunus dulcis TaxID=3755 RepID=A0A5H2XJ13_PRUDU|nr:hypothetical protein Prudu_332S000100 [Prunus dulcis]
MVIQRIVDRSPGYSELANPRSRILIKLYTSLGGDDYTEFGAPGSATSAATAPALMDHLAVGPRGVQAPASSASSAAQLLAPGASSPASTTDTTSTDASVSQPAKKNTRGSCRQLKTAKVTRVTNNRINIDTTSDIRLHRRWSCIAPWPTTLVMSFGAIAR